MNYIEHIDINALIRDLKKEHSLQSIHDIILKGVLFKRIRLKTSFVEYKNELSQKMSKWYFFECPNCKRRIKKAYIVGNALGCRECLRVKNKFKINRPSDRIFKIQKHLSDLFSGKLSPKKRKLAIKYVIGHYNRLDDGYKMAYNTFVFKALQDWCLDNLEKKEISGGYREAVRDVLSILKNSKKILIETNLAKSKNTHFV